MYIIIDLKTKSALYGKDKFTLLFDEEKEATNLARQFFSLDDHFAVVKIKIKPPVVDVFQIRAASL